MSEPSQSGGPPQPPGSSGARQPPGQSESRDGGFHAAQPAPPAKPGPSVVHRIRKGLGQAIWVVCSLAALVLALGALFIAFKANDDNSLVKAVLDAADRLDLGVFDKDEGIKQWTSENAQTKNALFNWGLGALVWLTAGWLLDRIVRPTSED